MPVHYLTNNSKGSISHHSAIGIFDAVEPAAALRLLCNLTGEEHRRTFGVEPGLRLVRSGNPKQ